MVWGGTSMIGGRASMVWWRATMIGGRASIVRGRASIIGGRDSMVWGRASMIGGRASMVWGREPESYWGPEAWYGGQAAVGNTEELLPIIRVWGLVRNLLGPFASSRTKSSLIKEEKKYLLEAAPDTPLYFIKSVRLCPPLATFFGNAHIPHR